MAGYAGFGSDAEHKEPRTMETHLSEQGAGQLAVWKNSMKINRIKRGRGGAAQFPALFSARRQDLPQSSGGDAAIASQERGRYERMSPDNRRRAMSACRLA